jgi:uncharacterized membrane protein required for colicin V production
MLDPALFLDPALYASMTWVDWLIVGLPAGFVLIGFLIGGTSLMLFGLIRLLTGVPLAAVPAAYVATYQKPLVQQIADQLNVQFAMAQVVVNAAVFIVALIVIYRVLGVLWRGLRSVLSTSFIGRALDRLAGIPLGLFIGVLLCAIVVIPPAVQYRSTLPQIDQPPGLRSSVLLPMIEQQIRDLMHYLPAPG